MQHSAGNPPPQSRRSQQRTGTRWQSNGFLLAVLAIGCASVLGWILFTLFFETLQLQGSSNAAMLASARLIPVFDSGCVESDFLRRFAGDRGTINRISVHNDPAVQAEQSNSCAPMTGWFRVLSLYLAHWDVVNLLSVSTSSSLDANAQALHQLALCAAPLVLNSFGISPVAKCGIDQWYSVKGGCVPGRYFNTSAGLIDDSVKPPHWTRLDAKFPRETQLFASKVLPDVSNVAWQSNQHSSAELRPADVSVYIIDATIEADVRRALSHMEVQLQETLQAVILYGELCPFHFRYRSFP